MGEGRNNGVWREWKADSGCLDGEITEVMGVSGPDRPREMGDGLLLAMSPRQWDPRAMGLGLAQGSAVRDIGLGLARCDTDTVQWVGAGEELLRLGKLSSCTGLDRWGKEKEVGEMWELVGGEADRLGGDVDGGGDSERTDVATTRFIGAIIGGERFLRGSGGGENTRRCPAGLALRRLCGLAQ